MKRVLVTARIFGHLSNDSFDIFKKNGFEVVENPYRGKRLSEGQLLELIGGIHALLSGVDQVTARVISAADQLKVISKFGTGIDNIDIEAATQKGIIVTNAPAVNADAVADMAFSLMLAIARKVPFAFDQVKKGQWPLIVGTEVWRKTLGVVGLGQIGKRVAMRAGGFQMKILAHEIHPDNTFVREHQILLVPLNRLLQESDFVSIHVPFTPETENLIRKDQLRMMKPTAFLVNTARGGIVDENALYEALQTGEIAGAAFDVLFEEPPTSTRLAELENCIVTPHISPFTREAIEKTERLSAQNIIDVLGGQVPLHVVNSAVLKTT